MALLSAVATLLAALFVCLGAGEPAAHDMAGRDMAGRAAHAPHTTVVADEYVCPYDDGDCSLFPSLSPAVLTAPPLDPPPHAEGRLPRPAPSYDTGWAPRPDAQPRAPDLHVLQVLRT
ncbi:hypothetical protein ACF06X_03545 [Streptomyces sp. NPDC015346]|uniref:hypothetical protein n=1 Tax=Streptomyces sp. NPDC015346 TaxID=3364954 RepID=UPI0036FB6178